MSAPNLAVADIKPFIGAKDFNASRDFYVALGWKITHDSDDLRVLELAGQRFYLQRYYNQEWCENTMLHMMVEDVRDWFEVVKGVFDSHTFAGGARMTDAIRDEGYADTFHVWDPAGVLLHFAQEKA